VSEPSPGNIYLIGMRGAGKTVVGQRLADRIDRPFVDLDREQVRALGATIGDFVAASGWPAFRRREKTLLKRIAAKTGQVVATGGGVVTDDENTEVMRASGWVVWLRADLSTLRRRLIADRNSAEMRPALDETSDAMTEIGALARRRQQSYAKAMHACVATDGQTVDTVCRLILEQFRAYWRTQR